MPEGEDMFCVKHGIAATRSIRRCIVPVNDTPNLRIKNKRHIRQTILETGESARLVGRSKIMDKNDVYREKWDLARVDRVYFYVLCLCIRESLL